jgi:acetylornithine deacetylase
MKTVSEILLDLVAIPSVSSAANQGVIEYALTFLDTDFWAIDLHKYPDGAGVEKTNLVAHTRNLTGPTAELAFVCHTDTVPYEASWSEAIHPAIRDGRLYGRGSCDVKGFLACVLAALSQADPQSLSRPLALVLTADEEVGCVGAKHLVQKNAIRSRYCVIGEPTSLRPVRAGKGYALAEIVVRGKESHSAFPGRGRSAIYDAAHIVRRLEKLAQDISAKQNLDFDPPFTTLNVGLIRGGTVKNIIPGECRITVEWRPVPGQDPEWVGNLLREELSKSANERPGLEAELHILRMDPPFEPSSTRRLAGIVELIGHRPATTVAFGSEAAHLRPVMDEIIVFGPGDMTTAHKSGECVSITELNQCVEILSELIVRLCKSSGAS